HYNYAFSPRTHSKVYKKRLDSEKQKPNLQQFDSLKLNTTEFPTACQCCPTFIQPYHKKPTVLKQLLVRALGSKNVACEPERERMKTMKIHEKMTYSTKIKAKQKGVRKALQKEEQEEARKEATNEERLKTLQESLPWKIAIKKEKETFRDYINDKREIFLLEYAMAVKRDEMQRMENIARKEESKLEKAKYCLEKDAAMFDEFLKENHKNCVQALKIAEKETTAKTKKTTEIQAITSQIENLQSDISRFKNTLKEYKMYRDFLYQLSPKEWQEKHGKKHTKGKDLKTAPKANEANASPPSTAEQGDEQSGTSAHGRAFEQPGLVQTNFHVVQWKRSYRRTKPHHMCFPLQEPELYFTDPQQLLSIFMEIEEENLSFIQRSQEIEESLDKVQHTFITTHESTEKKLAELKQQVVTLKSSIAKEEERVADLKLKVHLFSSGESEADDQDKMLTSLNEKVLEVYCQCTGENEANLETMEMLMVIEKQLNNLLDNLERIPPAKIEQAEKVKKKEQRIRRIIQEGIRLPPQIKIKTNQTIKKLQRAFKIFLKITRLRIHFLSTSVP
uniref:Cilia and flagella associated protein 100 n=1 Tax=Strix occidentalis caurina TaxID=311401 RepID=A0A8D0G1E4_STROC